MRGWWTQSVRRRHALTPGITMINYKVDNISKYVCLTVKINIVEKSANLSIFKILMSNDDVITK